MKAAQHRQKAEFIEHSLAKCGGRDWEMKIEAAMLAGVHWANYILHLSQLTAAEEDLVRPSALAADRLARCPSVEQELLRDLVEIESLRPHYVHGDAPGAQTAADRALVLLERIGDRARAMPCRRR